MGSRFGGLKQVVPVGPGGELILDYSVHDALKAGFGRVCFVIRRDIENEFRHGISKRYAGRVELLYAHQEAGDLPSGGEIPPGRVKPWGTAHAIRSARKAVKEPFAAINADDYYGPVAFRLLAEALSKAGSGDWSMVAFTMEKTLSENGHVSRGVCRVDGKGFLEGVREVKGIRKKAGAFVSEEGTETFTGAEPVSMNCWGFTPDLFDVLEKGFPAFLKGPGDPLTKEYQIPSVVDGAIQSGTARVQVLTSPDSWIGVTYKEDTTSVISAFARKVSAGEYPSPLWAAKEGRP